MNKKRLHYLLIISLIVLSVASIGYAGIQYFALSGKIIALFPKGSVVTQASVQSVLHSFGLAWMGSVTFALLTITVLLSMRQGAEAQVIYVKKNETDEKANTETEANDETSAAKYTGHIQTLLNENNHDLKAGLEKALSAVCRDLEASQAALFVVKQYEGKRILEIFATYAYHIAESKTFHYEFGEGLAGQVAKEGKLVNINSVPEGYITILSGLGKASPKHLVIAPIHFEDSVVAVLEVASFKQISKADEQYIREVAEMAGQGIAGQFSEQEVVLLQKTALI